MSLVEYRPNHIEKSSDLPDPLSSMDLWHMCGLRSAWVQIGIVASAIGAMPSEEYVWRTLTSRGVPEEYHDLRPGARVQYSLPDGGTVCGALARDGEWLTHSYRTIPDDRYSYEQAMNRLENEIMTFAVEVPVRHALIQRKNPDTMRIPVDARDIGLLTDESGLLSRLHLLPTEV